MNHAAALYYALSDDRRRDRLAREGSRTAFRSRRAQARR